MEIAALHEDGATLRLPLKREHQNGAGVVHGGVTATLADAAVGVALTKVLKRRGTTIELKINYLEPAVDGELRAPLIHPARRAQSDGCPGRSALRPQRMSPRRWRRSPYSKTGRRRRRPLHRGCSGQALIGALRRAAVSLRAAGSEARLQFLYEPFLLAKISCATRAASSLLRRSKSSSYGVNIRGAGEAPSLRLSTAVEGVTEMPPLPFSEVLAAPNGKSSTAARSLRRGRRPGAAGPCRRLPNGA